MCLAIPMQIIAIDGFNAQCEAKGIQRDVSLFMLQHDKVKLHDHVLVHVGYAIQKISKTDAITAWQVYDEMLALEQQNAEKMMSQVGSGGSGR
jgi:hydrogenase expression/formation protein HypC